MISTAERALCEIERRMKRIRTEDGYHTNAGANVFRARSKIDVARLPCANIFDSGEDPKSRSGDLSSGTFGMDLNVDIELHAAANQENTGEMLEKLKADCKRALFGNGNAHGHLGDGPKGIATSEIGSIGYTGARASPRQDGATSESITMTFIVRYPEDFSNL